MQDHRKQQQEMKQREGYPRFYITRVLHHESTTSMFIVLEGACVALGLELRFRQEYAKCEVYSV
jgi:hypothetical protein